MAGSVNRVVLVGTMGKYGVSLRYAPSGAPCASFSLVCTEQGPEGKYFSTLIPCEVWGKRAEASSEIEAGECVLFEGKVSRRKKGEQWEFVITGSRFLSGVERLLRTRLLTPFPACPSHLLPLASGVLDLHTMPHTDHAPNRYLRYALPYAYDPSASCPTARHSQGCP